MSKDFIFFCQSCLHPHSFPKSPFIPKPNAKKDHRQRKHGKEFIRCHFNAKNFRLLWRSQSITRNDSNRPGMSNFKFRSNQKFLGINFSKRWQRLIFCVCCRVCAGCLTLHTSPRYANSWLCSQHTGTRMRTREIFAEEGKTAANLLKNTENGKNVV